MHDEQSQYHQKKGARDEGADDQNACMPRLLRQSELLNVHLIGKVSEEVDATVGEYNPEGERKKSTHN